MGKRDEMENSAQVKGANEGLLEHNFSQSVGLIDLRTIEGSNQREESMKRLSRMMCFQEKCIP